MRGMPRGERPHYDAVKDRPDSNGRVPRSGTAEQAGATSRPHIGKDLKGLRLD